MRLAIFRDKSGATAVEYSLIVALIFLGVLGAVPVLGESVDGMFNTIAGEFTNVVGVN